MQNKHISGFTLESDYEYVLGEVQGMIIQLEAALSRPGDFEYWELEHIAEEMVSTAKWFAESQGLRNTGQLIDNIKYNQSALHEGKIIVYDDVVNERGHYYAGHHEYGYHTRNGRFIQARPFLRPAMRAVEQASLGRITSAALEVAGFTGGMHTPKINKHGSFGMNSRYMRAFFRNTDHNYTVKGLQAKNGNQISQNLGKSYTINRRTDSKTGTNIYGNAKDGYRYVRWDAPYSSFNAYKQSLIYTGKNEDAWRR